MRQLDRYIFRQVAVAFLFFCLILAGLIWLTQAVRLIDTVLSSGQSLWRLFEFSLLVLPRVLTLVVPVSAFAATIFALNKLYSEAELVVMMMSGQGPFALARPIAAFGVLMALVTLVLTHFVAPMGERKLIENRNEIRSEIANSLIREGRFLHPIDGLTLFIQETGQDGRMSGMFLQDDRQPERPVTYTAEEAVFLRDGGLAQLVMRRGIALNYDAERNVLARVQFDSFSYDLSELVAPGQARPVRADSLPTATLFSPDESLSARDGFSMGDFIATAHERFVLGAVACVLPLLALALMLTGGYQRRGFGRRIVLTVAVGLAVIIAGVLAKSLVLGTPKIWYVSYIPVLIGLAAAVFLLKLNARDPRRRAAPA